MFCAPDVSLLQEAKKSLTGEGIKGQSGNLHTENVIIAKALLWWRILTHSSKSYSNARL